MMKSVTDIEEKMDPHQQKIVDHGTYVHEKVQSSLMQYMPNAYPEYTVKDKKLKMTGHIDMVVPMMLNGKREVVPVEIKTISEKALSKMSGPKPYHRGQAQFYLHETGAPFEKFVYVAREDPSKYKIFDIERSEEEFQYWYKRFKSYQGRAKAQGNTLATGPNNLELAWDMAKQPGFNAMRSSDIIYRNQDVDAMIGMALGRSNIADFSTTPSLWEQGYASAFSGINTSSSVPSDFQSGATHDKDGKHKAVPNQVSTQTAESQTVASIRSGRPQQRPGIIKKTKNAKIADPRGRPGMFYKRPARSKCDNYTTRGTHLSVA